MNLRQIFVALSLSLTALVAVAQSPSGWVQLDKRPERKIVERPGDGSVTTNSVTVDLFYSPKIDKNGSMARVSVLRNAEEMTGGKSVIFDFEFDCKKISLMLSKVPFLKKKWPLVRANLWTNN